MGIILYDICLGTRIKNKYILFWFVGPDSTWPQYLLIIFKLEPLIGGCDGFWGHNIFMMDLAQRFSGPEKNHGIFLFSRKKSRNISVSHKKITEYVEFIK